MLNKQSKQQQQYATASSINGSYEIGLGKQIIDLSPDKTGNRNTFEDACMRNPMRNSYRIDY